MHTHILLLVTQTVRVCGDVNQAAGFLCYSRSITALISEQTHVYNHILVGGFQTTSAIFILFLNEGHVKSVSNLPVAKIFKFNAHLSIVHSALPIQAKNNTCQYTFLHLTYKITMKIIRGIKQLL